MKPTPGLPGVLCKKYHTCPVVIASLQNQQGKSQTYSSATGPGLGFFLKWVWLKMKQGVTQGLVYVSTYQGNPCWYRFFEPQPNLMDVSRFEGTPFWFSNLGRIEQHVLPPSPSFTKNKPEVVFRRVAQAFPTWVSENQFAWH